MTDPSPQTPDEWEYYWANTDDVSFTDMIRAIQNQQIERCAAWHDMAARVKRDLAEAMLEKPYQVVFCPEAEVHIKAAASLRQLKDPAS